MRIPSLHQHAKLAWLAARCGRSKHAKGTYWCGSVTEQDCSGSMGTTDAPRLTETTETTREHTQTHARAHMYKL